MDKNLKDKAIDIKGKAYVLVSDRVLYFNENYPKGSITTELVSAPTDKQVIVKATVIPEEGRVFTGYSQAVMGEGMVNKTAALENAETSSVGRALAFMGIGVIESIASADEIHKATSSKPSTTSDKVCSVCGAKALKSPKTGNDYCPNWKKHKEEGVYAQMVASEDQKFMDSLPTEDY